MTSITVLLNSTLYGANAWFALAVDRGFFVKENLEVSFVHGTGAYRVPATLAEGAFDVAFGDMPALIELAAASPQTAPLAILPIHTRTPAVIAVMADGPIRTPADLAGRHLVGHASDVALRLFPAYAAKAGLDRKTVRITISDKVMRGMLDELLDGEAEGVFGYRSSQVAVLSPEQSQRLRFLRFHDVVPDLPGSVLMAKRTAWADKQDALMAFCRATTRAIDATAAAPEAALAAIAKRTPSMDEASDRARLSITFSDEIAYADRRPPFDHFDAAALSRVTALMAETYPLPRRPDLADFVAPCALAPSL